MVKSTIQKRSKKLPKTKREINIETNEAENQRTQDLVGVELSNLFSNVKIPPVKTFEISENVDVLLKELFPNMKPSTKFNEIKKERLDIEEDDYLESIIFDDEITDELRSELEEEEDKE